MTGSLPVEVNSIHYNPAPMASSEDPTSPTWMMDFYETFEFNDTIESAPKKSRRDAELNFKDRLIALKNREMVKPGSNILDHWHSCRNVDQPMAAVAAVVLGLPVTQVTVERAFSHLPLVMTDRRNRLLSTTVNNILVAKLNSTAYKPDQ